MTNFGDVLNAYKRGAAIKSPAKFAHYASKGKWQLAPHLKLLNQKLLAVARGEIKRLIVQMPPRHGKSELISKYFPAWFIGTHPDKRVILASYESDFAQTWGRAARDLLQEHGELFGVTLNRDSSAASRWDLVGRSGGMSSMGVGGAITGKGADVFVIDDPIKGPEEAHSHTTREKQWEWYRSVAHTRLEPGASMVLTMTRWHEEDLAGRLLEEAQNGGEQWEVVSLPAIAEEGDPLGREVGEPLWPERFPLEDLASKERTSGSYVWSALYQQRPTPAAGNIIQRHWFRYWRPVDRAMSPVIVRLPDGSQVESHPVELPPKFDMVMQSWDLAFKDTKSSDYVVGQVWGWLGEDCFLLDQSREKRNFPDTVADIKRMSEKWPKAERKLVEEKANGAALIAALEHEMYGIIAINPTEGKEARCHAITARMESGNVYIPHPHLASWVEGFIEECVSFPSAKHDDQVDAMTQFLNDLSTRCWTSWV